MIIQWFSNRFKVLLATSMTSAPLQFRPVRATTRKVRKICISLGLLKEEKGLIASQQCYWKSNSGNTFRNPKSGTPCILLARPSKNHPIFVYSVNYEKLSTLRWKNTKPEWLRTNANNKSLMGFEEFPHFQNSQKWSNRKY